MRYINLFFLTLILFSNKLYAQENEIAGKWNGEWKDNKGYLYSYEMNIEGDRYNNIAGKIIWKLVKSPRFEDKEKLNMYATEYIYGNYHPDKREMIFKGIGEFDPWNIIGVGEYILKMSETKMSFEGKTTGGEIKGSKLVETNSIDYSDGVQGFIEIYNTGYDVYSYIKPADLNTYKFLSYYPLTAFLFCLKTNEEIIANMSVKDLKSLKFISSNSLVYSLFYIKGFEDYAEEISKLDEFGIHEKKAEYINKLQECYRNYNHEFQNRYLQTEMKLYAGTTYSELRDRLKIYGSESTISEINPSFIELKKENYDFDNQMLKINIPFFGYNYGSRWDISDIKVKIYHQFRGDDWINIPIPISQFKNFLDNYNFGLYEMKVKPSINIRSTLYGSMYHINLLEFDKLDIVIIDAYTRTENYGIIPANELYRVNIF